MSTQISKELQDFLKGKLGWVATASSDGLPNVTPKGTIQVLDDQTIIFADLFSVKTRANLLANPKAAVTVIDQEKGQGYQFKGTAELLDSGPIYEQVAAALKQAPRPLPQPKYVAKITVEEIFNQSPGSEAGQKIG